MQHKHDDAVPLALEAVVAQLGTLLQGFGPGTEPVAAAIRASLIAAMAARDRGDRAGAIAEIGGAMEQLIALTDRLDPAEALLMRAIAERVRSSLQRGDLAGAKHGSTVMFEKSGAVERQRS
jgi:hypothetical protein